MSAQTVELLKFLAALSVLITVIIAGSRTIKLVKDTANSLETMKGALAASEKRLLDLWFAAEEIGSTRPKLLVDFSGHETWDTSLVRGLLRSARTRVRILQTWFPEMEGDLDRWAFNYPELLVVEILMAHSANPAIIERVRYRSDFPAEESEQALSAHIDNKVKACTSRLRSLFGNYKKSAPTFSGSLLLYRRGMPFGPIYIIDEIVVFGIYPPNVNCNAAPMMRVSLGSATGKLIEKAYDTMRHQDSTEEVYAA